MDTKSIVLENNQEYFVGAETNYNNTTYYFLINLNDNYDCAIRKEEGDDLVGLDDYKELENIIMRFSSEQKDNPSFNAYMDKLKNN